MLFSQAGSDPSRGAGIAASAATHAALLLLLVLLVTLHFGRVHTAYRESRCCSATLYWTGEVGADTPKDKPAARTRQPKSVHRPAPEEVSNASPIASTKSRQSVPGIQGPPQQTTVGTGTGTEDAEPAFPTFFPRPAVADRSLLPAVERKVIVNVSVSAQGEVTDEKLIQGLGNALDQIVLKTVKTWHFQPATLNGTAIASVEQLVFPFNRQFGLEDGGASNG
jgi:TonB family protein